MTNFDYLLKEQQFESFSKIAVSAERVVLVDADSSIIASRRAMEAAVKWMYSVDVELLMPYQDNLQNLMDAEEYRDIVGTDIHKRMTYIRKTGNAVAHGTHKYGRDEALLCLENLAIFMDFVACCYGEEYTEHGFDSSLITDRQDAAKQRKEEFEEAKKSLDEKEKSLKALIAENAGLKEELSKRRQDQQQVYIPKPLDLSEYKTRKLYIDAMLTDAGWKEGVDWINEVELPGMPNKSEVGYADYVLYDDTHKPLAVVEAKRTCVDETKGRQQAKLYADLLEEKYGRRPVIFLTNGFSTRIIDGKYPERKCASIYSKRDLLKWFNLLSMRTSLKNVFVDREIAGRYYQEAAIKAVCESFDGRNRRKALLVMATGSGKTRTVVALCKVLLNAGWVKKILFLADRNALVTQAKRAFVNLLPNLSVTNLVEEKDKATAHCVFSTYQTMMGCIDEVEDDDGKLFTIGHFDLVICDEAHRSIYNKYQDIFNYFDAPLVGLTATPKDEINKNTYDIFELANGTPTYGYDLAQAVTDKYLVDYVSIETETKFIEEGIDYEELSDEEKEEYEATFTDENGDLNKHISSSALNTWLFNEDTIRKVLYALMTDGLKVDYGTKIGKTIIFAKNHDHAERIKKVFDKEYPHLPNHAKVIDNYMTYAQSAIDEFSDPKKEPQIAISVDMLDTGIDIPEILNLVFFKKVLSKAKFWQMIGRGTRLCPELIDGEDKKKFYIFDFCSNFKFFRLHNGKPTPNLIPLQGAIFDIEFQMAYKLQDLEHQTERLIAYRDKLVEMMVGKVKELNREKFDVKQHLKYVDLYSNKDNYNGVTFPDTQIVRVELCPLLLPDDDDAKALRFDYLIYSLELAYLLGKKNARARGDLIRKVSGLASVGNIPEIKAQSDLIEKILHTSYIDSADIDEFEKIREALRDLIKYIPKGGAKYDTDWQDTIISSDWNDAELDNDDLKPYKERAAFYIRQNKDNIVIGKLRTNKPLTEFDIKSLQEILWSEVGTKEDYEKELGDKPLGVFVREIIGLDMNAAKEAFAEYVNEADLNSKQIYFVNQIIEYIARNGMLTDMSILGEAPFTDMGTVSEIFTNQNIWKGIRSAIDLINTNAVG